MIVNYKINLLDVLKMLVFNMPFFLEFVIPMSVMMAVLLTFLRMSGDNEIIAVKSGGLSLYSLIPPVAVFCLFGTILTAVMAIYGLPWGRLSFKELVYTVAQSNIDVGLKERTFNDQFEGVTLYVTKIDMQDKRLVDVFIEDQRAKDTVSTVVAPEGRIYKHPENQTYHLRLFNGTINRVTLESRSVHTVRFKSYDIALDLDRAVGGAGKGVKDEEEMSLSELHAYLQKKKDKDDRYYLALMELHKKFSLPVACFALGILAVPLGVRSKTTTKSFGVGLALVFFLFYYVLLSAGWVFGEAGIYPPAVGMWVPNVVMGGIGVFMLVRATQERSIGIESVLYLGRKLTFRWPRAK